MAAPGVSERSRRLYNELALAQAEIDVLDADIGGPRYTGNGLARGRRTYDPISTRLVPYESGDIGAYDDDCDDDDYDYRPRGRRQQTPAKAAYDDNEDLEDLYDEIGELQIVAAQQIKSRQRAQQQAQQQAQLTQAGYGYPQPGPYPPPQPYYGYPPAGPYPSPGPYPPPGPYAPPAVQAALQNGQSGENSQTVVIHGLPENLQNQEQTGNTMDALFIPEDVDIEYDCDGNPIVHRRQGNDGISADVVNVPDKKAGIIYPEASIDAFVPLDGDHTFKIEAPTKPECIVPDGQFVGGGPPGIGGFPPGIGGPQGGPPGPMIDANGQLLVPTGRYKVQKIRVRKR